jgi:NAD(P)-dependent dehydrogenase (short-subunit alcohol dehydrogenase family)
MPGRTNAMQPKPDHGESTYRGCGRLLDKKAVITGADSGIGRAVAIAYAREGADVAIAYLNEHEDAQETRRFVEEAGRKAVVVAGAVAPGPIWTPLIPSTMSEESVVGFGGNVPMKRPGQPAELATAYVMLADPLSSYVSGATIAVTGGKPIL